MQSKDTTAEQLVKQSSCIETCAICGDPITGTCPRYYPERIVIFPPELQPGDFLITTCRAQPLKVFKVSPPENDTVIADVMYGGPLEIEHMELPLLVKRQILCGGPACELHCAQCHDRPQMTAILGTVESEKERIKRRRKADRANARELIRPQSGRERQHKK